MKTLALFLIFSSFVLAEEVQVFILTGQSNSLGIIKDGESISLPTHPNDQKVRFYWENRDPRAKIVSTSKGKIERLQVQKFNNSPTHANYGLEMSCFRTLSLNMKNILLIKVSRGGGGNKFWFKDSKDNHMYRALVETSLKALKQLKNQKYKIRGLIYLQGESDGNDCNIADQRASTLLNNLKVDLPNSTSMQMYIGGIAGNRQTQAITRMKHAELAKNRQDIHFIKTEDLLKKGLYKDRLHFNNKSKEIIGNRFAEIILKSNDKK